MDKEKQPKERIVFDEDTYDDEFWHDICTYWQNQQEEFWEPYDPDSPDDYLMADLIREDYENEMAALTAFFDTGKSDMSSFENPLAGNPVIVSGTIGRWDGERRGFSPFKSLADALSTSPSRFGEGNPLADCEIQKVWDENGHLFVHGAHHDGSVTVEVRQLTDEGAAALEAIEDAWVGEPFEAGGRTYDGSMQSVNQAMRDLWDAPSLCPAPRYMEQCFGCPAEEWQLAPLPMERIGFEEEISEVGDLLNFYIPVTFDVDSVFGTDVTSLGNDDWLNLYADYDMKRGEVSDHLDISLNRADGSIEELTYPLDAGQREALRQKMDAYCKEQVGKSLDEYAKELVQPETVEMKTPEVSAGRSVGKATASVSLSGMAAESRAASQALAGDDGHDDRVQDAR